jgi:hypothetical protein
MPDPQVDANGNPIVPEPPLGGDKNFLLSLPEELQNEPSLQDFTGEDGQVKLARSFVETKRMVGDRIPIPTDENDPKWGEVYARLGRPETADKYEFQKVEVPASLPIDETMVKGFKEKAFELGLSAKAANALNAWYLNTMGAVHTKILADYDTEVKGHESRIKEAWGANFEPNMQLAMKTFERYATPEIKKQVEASGLGNNPFFVELFYKVGTEMSEDILRGAPPALQGIDDEIKTLRSSEAFLNEFHLEHKQAVKRMDELMQKRYPEPATS